MKKNLIISIIISLFLGICWDGSAYDRNERRGIERIEELILRENYRAAKRRCDAFLRKHKRTRAGGRIKFLRNVALQKLDMDIRGKKPEKNIYNPERPTGIYYLVQVGAFKKLRNAKKLKRSLIAKEFDTAILKTKQGHKIYYKVMTGKFRNLDNAERLVRQLVKKGYIAEIVPEG